MRVRYKRTGGESFSSRFNTASVSEVLTGDDSPDISELDVFVNGAWKDMRKAFADNDIVPNNLNTSFGPPLNDECRKRGYNP